MEQRQVCFNASALIAMLQEYQPKMTAQLGQMNEVNFAESYANYDNISMDYRLAEKVAAVPLDMAWVDLVRWDSVYQKQ